MQAVYILYIRTGIQLSLVRPPSTPTPSPFRTPWSTQPPTTSSFNFVFPSSASFLSLLHPLLLIHPSSSPTLFVQPIPFSSTTTRHRRGVLNRVSLRQFVPRFSQPFRPRLVWIIVVCRRSIGLPGFKGKSWPRRTSFRQPGYRMWQPRFDRSAEFLKSTLGMRRLKPVNRGELKSYRSLWDRWCNRSRFPL